MQLRASLLTESVARAGGPSLSGLSLPVVVAASVGAHLAIAGVLAALPTVGRLAGVPEDLLVAVDYFEPAPVPAPLPEPVVEEVPPPVAAVVRERRVETPEPEPEPIVEEIVPEPPIAAAMPPSVDEAFGDPPPPMDSLTATAGAGAFTVAAGEPDGAPGGRAGGTPGGTVGAGGSVVSAGTAVDDGSARRRARDAYKRELERFLREHMTYPRAAARERLEGRVELALRIGSDGSLLGVRVSSSSGSDLLDREAMETTRDAGVLPAPPAPCALAASDELRVGMVYRLR